MARPIPRLSPAEAARIVATAWDDRAPYPRVLMTHGLNEGQLVQLMRRELTPNAFKLWKQRSAGR